MKKSTTLFAALSLIIVFAGAISVSDFGTNSKEISVTSKDDHNKFDLEGMIELTEVTVQQLGANNYSHNPVIVEDLEMPM